MRNRHVRKKCSVRLALHALQPSVSLIKTVQIILVKIAK